MADPAPRTLGYWKTRGLGEHIRMLLTHLELPFEDVMYETGDPPHFDKTCWLSKKFTLGLDFPNLPHFIDEDIRITESDGVLKFICRKYKPDYLGTTVEEKATIEMLIEVVGDLKRRMTRTCYSPAFASLKRDADAYVRERLECLARWLQPRTWAVAERPTLADFDLFESLAFANIFYPGGLAAISDVFARYSQQVRTLKHVAEFDDRRPRLKFKNKYSRLPEPELK